MPKEKLKEKGAYPPFFFGGDHPGLHDGPHPPLFPEGLDRGEPPLHGPRLPRLQNPSQMEVHPQSLLKEL